MANSPIDFNSPVWTLLHRLSTKAGITEIVINGSDDVLIEKDGQFLPVDVKISADSIQQFIQDVAVFNKKDCDEINPIFNGVLPDGSRINITLSPIRMEGPAITVRKFLKTIQTFDSQKGIFGLSADWVHFLRAAVKARLNILVSGGTGVGKTTFMNLMLQEVDRLDRKIIIEDVRELNVNVPNTIRMETVTLSNGRFVSVRDLVKNGLRMRPDRIIIGEVRGEEIFDLLQAMNTGHQGCFASIHANSPRECLSRIEALYLLSGYEVPFHAIRHQVGKALDLIIQLTRNRKGMRVVSNIAEVTDLSGDQILLQDLGILEKDMDYLVSTGLVPKNIERLEKCGLSRKLFHSDAF